MYEHRANMKKNRTAAYYENLAKACEVRGDAEGAFKWKAFAQEKNLESKPKAKEVPKAKEESDATRPKR